MPLHFSDEEMTLLLELSRPIEPAQRSAFLDAVATAIGEQASGPGLVHVTARRIQRGILDAAGAFAQHVGAPPPRPRRLKKKGPGRLVESCIPAKRLPGLSSGRDQRRRSGQPAPGHPGTTRDAPRLGRTGRVRERLAFIAGADDMVPLRKMGVIAARTRPHIPTQCRGMFLRPVRGALSHLVLSRPVGRRSSAPRPSGPAGCMR
jgi:hypothetical protein